MAEYTNRVFPTTKGDVALPEYRRPDVKADIIDLCWEAESKGRPQCPAGIRSGEVTFGSIYVRDALRAGASAVNSRAYAFSVFDSDLQRKLVGPVYALNRFTVEATYPFLFPRAVAYSNGIINYFFRGEMEITLPDEGLYAIIDHTLPEHNTKNTGGFPLVKLNIQNITKTLDSDGKPIVEPMSTTTGSLMAVVSKRLSNGTLALNKGR